jgi:hypothetical protein
VKTLYIAVKGGLGNQLFQAAFGIALEHSLGVTARFLTESFATDTHGRSYLLDAFPALRNRNVLAQEVAGAKLLTEDALAPLTPAQRVEQIEMILEAEDRLVVDGYWQDERYWGASADVIRATLRPAVDPQTLEAGEKIRAIGAIGLHVRRGDYGHHGLARVEYFLRSLQALRDETGVRLAFYATDEPNFCRYEFRGIPDLVALPGNPLVPFNDFFLLSCCRHFVVSNSSFSWWAAFLGETTGSIVYAPQPWCIFDAAVNPVGPRWRNIAGAVQRQ